ncbi:DNA methylase [Croceibacterium mercuriale]|uniref:site-specific DNA-methyltransferase (adenine-specific) n=1 Tax=Croceibacterium mercuriale TaxID=1572751 RepID=A0A0B2BWZ4_9SPHN|nr:site-specific DNA-methyltransferase [Croceibacterium mercuriale]KHL24158.1 DNA methylase [Croceibacterium mercuriale]
MAKKPLSIDSLNHAEATRRNAPTAELEPFVGPDMKRPIEVAYERRNRDLDPQLVWRGKDVADWSDLVVEAPPLYIQEKIHPKALIEDLKRVSPGKHSGNDAPDLFADFNGVEPDARTEFYAHDQHWSNRMILGDGLKVMASLAEREGLKGQVQCIYIDPPYGIKFNSNFQWSTTSRDVKDGKADHLTREPEQVKAFRDTWRDGIHSYLTYLRDRLTVARDLLTESGSVFVQIGDENVHRVRALMDEVFGAEHFLGQVAFSKTSGLATSDRLPSNFDYLLWFSKTDKPKYRSIYQQLDNANDGMYRKYQMPDGRRFSHIKGDAPRSDLITKGAEFFRPENLTKPGPGRKFEFGFEGRSFGPGGRWFGTTPEGMAKLSMAGRLDVIGNTLVFVKKASDTSIRRYNNFWSDTSFAGFNEDKVYVVQTNTTVIERCILMTTDPGDLVLDPTCGSGTTATVAEQWGRRWITMDTSRVALALARARIMGARYPWYLLADSREGQLKEGEVTRSPPRDTPVQGRLRQGFVYKRVPHITLKSIANNAEIDTIWESYQEKLEPLRAALNAALGSAWQEWEIPREAGADWPEETVRLHAEWWQQRIARQREIDASIAAKADTEYLYDQPYVDKDRVRVAGPFTVESLSPHRVPAVDTDDSLFDEIEAAEGRRQKEGSGERADFAAMVLENLQRSGVQQPHKADKLVFDGITLWPGRWIVAQGTVRQRSLELAEAEDDSTSALGAEGPSRRAAIFVGPEYGTVSRPDLTAAAREAAEAGFDILIAAAFNFDAHAGEMDRMGALTVLQARINPDLHMPDLANTGAGNLFTVFGEPDIVVHDEGDGQVSIEVMGVDMYKAGQIESGDADDIAVWFIDTAYDYESFFVRHAYFPGANDPYKALKTTLRAEIDEEAWASLNRTRSRPFARPATGRVAVKVVNHLGDEVMKVLEV